jgi:hypothetical protein
MYLGKSVTEAIDLAIVVERRGDVAGAFVFTQQAVAWAVRAAHAARYLYQLSGD